MPTPNRSKLHRLLSTCERHMDAARAAFDRDQEARADLRSFAARITPNRNRVYSALDRPLESIDADELRAAAADPDTCAEWHVDPGNLRTLARMKDACDRLREASTEAQREARPWRELHGKLEGAQRKLEGVVARPRSLEASDGTVARSHPAAAPESNTPAPIAAAATVNHPRAPLADVRSRLPSIEDLRRV